MPTVSCQFFWECPDCGEVLKPKRAIAAYFALLERYPVLLFKKMNNIAVSRNQLFYQPLTGLLIT